LSYRSNKPTPHVAAREMGGTVLGVETEEGRSRFWAEGFDIRQFLALQQLLACFAEAA